jgi:hypothetical protein
MRTNDITMLVFSFLLGTLLGIIATMSAYTAIGNKMSDSERQRADEALKKAEEERDQALARIDQYLDYEKERHLDLERGGSGQVAAVPPAGAATPAEQPPELLPAPREELTYTAGFGAPRQYGKN